jgi:hypothetical protein
MRHQDVLPAGGRAVEVSSGQIKIHIFSSVCTFTTAGCEPAQTLRGT